MGRKPKARNITYFKNRSKNAELELVKLLQAEGWLAQRTPTSASGNVEFGDVTAVKPGQFRAFEVKTLDEPKIIVIKKNQLEKLLANVQRYRYAGLFSIGHIAVRTFNPKRWHFYPVKNLPKSDLLIDVAKELGLEWFD